MKKMLQTLAFMALVFSANAQTDVILNIHHMFGDEPYVYDTPVTVEAGYEMKVTRIEYYLCDFVIIHDGGQQLALNDMHLLVDANEDVPFSLGSHDVTMIEGISFSVGVLEAVNHLDPAAYEVGEPLGPQLPSMHWGWAAGYRFLAFEGKSGVNLTTAFEIHALGDENLMNQSHALNVEAVSGVAMINLDADYLELTHNLDVSNGLIVHGTTDEAVDALLNMRSLVFSVSAPVSIMESTDYSVSIYPNPTDNRVTISLDPALQGGQLNIFNMQGQIVQSGIIRQSIEQVDISTLESGMYFVQIQSEIGTVGSILSVK